MAIVLISGITHSNKHLLAKKLEQKGMKRIQTVTTAPFFSGSPYKHITAEEYESLFNQNAFVESVRHAGEGFGLTRTELLSHLDSEQDTILVMTPSGVEKVQRYLKANGIQHVCIFLSVPTITAIERLTTSLKRGQLEEERFIHKTSALAQVETKWSTEAYTGKTFDIVYEVGDKHELDMVAIAVQTHVRSSKKSPTSVPKVSFERKIA